ncbi:TOMM precursor leader peptide-binding protein [Actinacidiphila paucisporea]|uniref:Ribosomal protein S12 methylthiotransferase accessory factor n=1 Tax=Actinacidiphila paucisporea TaxID=310782 RepID=A0A1M7K8W2_9ACTN|nr:TOMM precursor leader peptide-binding protein [Actinacidiphila paucisporea]SHM61413.1 ribosomal protein S12 methylthiotransferase accessory factor [Actinacidiphila paucisporea]
MTSPAAPPAGAAVPVRVGHGGPLAADCARFARQLALSLRCFGGGGDIVVGALGVRDELAVAGGADEDAAVGVHRYGHLVLVGPFGPDGGAGCPRCLARRWQGVRARALREALETGVETRAVGAGEVAFGVDGVAALIAAHRERAEGAAGRGRLPYAFLVDAETLRVTRFAFVPDAECPRCGVRAADTAEGARITFAPAPKPAPDVFRARPADDYDVPFEAFVNPAAGMLGPSVVPDLVSASTSSTVGSFLLRSGDYLRECFWGGHTPRYRSSERVGLLEGLERFAGMRPRGKRTAVVGSYDELAAEEAVLDPRSCGLYSADFHRAEPGVRPFDPGRPIPWVWGWSLRDQRPLLVPEILAYYHAPGGLRHRFVQESSNGCASGGSLAEAVYFGLMEVVERDAFLLAWYGRAPLPEIDVSGTRSPQTRAMIDRLAMYGYRARFFDTRISFPIPVVTAVAERVDGGLGRLCFGAGAGLDPEAALAAGLCEIATDAVNLRRRTARDEARLRSLAADFDQVLVLHDHPLLYGLPDMAEHADFLLREERPRVALADLPSTGPGALPPGDDLGDDVAGCVAAVAKAGFDVVVVDQTMPEQRELGFHTAGVIVPGLLPIDFGWRRQRARHLPRTRTALREAGLHDRDLTAADLNPAPHPFP